MNDVLDHVRADRLFGATGVGKAWGCMGLPGDKQLVRRLSTLAFAGFYLVYVWCWSNPLHLLEGGVWFPAFSRTPAFLARQVVHPGGPIEYVAAFLSQFVRWPWFGPVLLTVTLLTVVLAYDSIVAHLCGRQVRGVRFVPALLMLAVQAEFGYHVPNLVALAAALVAVLLYERVSARWPRQSVAVLLGLGLLVYYLVCGAFFLFALLCGLLEYGRRRQPLPGVAVLVLAPAVPYLVGVCGFGVTATEAYSRLLPYYSGGSFQGSRPMLALHVLLPLLAMACWRSVGSGSDVGRERTRVRWLRRLGRAYTRRSGWLDPASLVVVTALAVWGLGDGALRHRVRVGYRYRHGEWEKVVREAAFLKPDRYVLVVSYQVNRALFELGRLSEEMFCVPQFPNGLTLGSAMGAATNAEAYEMRKNSYFSVGDVDLRIGLLNDAEHWAHEVLEILGPHAVTLKHLYLVNAAKGQMESAAAFLRALRGCLFHRGWAEAKLEALSADPTLSRDAEVQQLRSRALLSDGRTDESELSYWCAALLEADPSNRMAFEYMMAYYLLNRRLDGFAGQLGRLQDLGYRRLPRHFGEAVLMHEAESGRRVDLGELEVGQETFRAFSRFTSLAVPLLARGDSASAFRAAAGEFGNTYFFYYRFGVSGLGTP